MSETTFDSIAENVRANGGVITVKASQLREAQGAGRLTQRINEEISEALRRRGLGHVPFYSEDMPTSQYEQVRVYDATSALGKIIEAAHTPGDDEDLTLREGIDGEAAGLLSQIRALIAE
ncbi:hypothetical protein [Rhodococcus wratislaviensis]|uniref:hypothetical protein n=1 Tax=Rhodococcus wratislaviensis TaxID=44752 RepID=UPI000F56265F|nr:hypothetical protein [Rhodococcus wratislaviensis]